METAAASGRNMDGEGWEREGPEPAPGAATLRDGGGMAREPEQPDSAEPRAAREDPGARTEPSEEQLCPTQAPLEELGSLDVLCDTEFKEDFVKMFESSQCTLPSIGLPALLAYRPESVRENIQIEAEGDSAPRCEYCGSLLRPFPSFEEVCPPSEQDESKFCCEHSRDLYEFIVSHRRSHEVVQSTCEDTESVPVALEPQELYSTGAKRLLSKERVHQRQQDKYLARQLAFQGAEPASVAEGSHQDGTISYVMSQEPQLSTGGPLLPESGAAQPEEEPDSCSIACCDFTVVGGMVVKSGLLEKYYKHGGKFITILPDGTVQILYPSGNLAIVLVQDKAQLICIIQEDKPSKAKVQAVFNSNGRGTCCYPNGAVWINMNIQGGQYSDQAGSRVRKWTWPNSTTSSGPHTPLSPIFISLNQYVGVRILSQDKIIVSFLAMGQQAKFNVGTKVQVSDGGQLSALAPLGQEELLLLAFRVKILWLLDRLRGCLNFPSNKQRDKIKPPAYLSTQTSKILRLCTSSDVSSELRSSIRAIVNAQV